MAIQWKETFIREEGPGGLTSAVNSFVYCFTRVSSGCVFQLTNFKFVWTEQLDSADIIRRGRSFGYTDLRSTSKRNQLLVVLNSVINGVHASLEFIPSNAEDDNSIRVSVNCDEVRWEFKLRKLSELKTSEFFTGMNFQQFGQMGYLKFQISELQNLLTRKDHYIKFLTENFKQANGAQFLQKYKKNNPSSGESVTPFEPMEWLTKIRTLYREKNKKLHSGGKEEIKRNLVHNAVSDEWTFGDINANADEDADEDADADADECFKDETTSSNPSSQPQSKSTSPKKRQRLGIISTRKKKKSSSQAQLSSQLYSLSSSQVPQLSAEDDGNKLFPNSPTKAEIDD